MRVLIGRPSSKQTMKFGFSIVLMGPLFCSSLLFISSSNQYFGKTSDIPMNFLICSRVRVLLRIRILDKILRPFIFYGPIYYLFDVLIKLFSGTVFQNACTFSFFWHHLVCIIFLPLGTWSPYVPWFCLVLKILF